MSRQSSMRSVASAHDAMGTHREHTENTQNTVLSMRTVASANDVTMGGGERRSCGSDAGDVRSALALLAV